MCMCSCGQPFGIAIPKYVEEQLPAETQEAWRVFDRWWHKRGDGESMPEDIAKCFDLLKSTQIPGQEEGITMEQSCYVQGVISQL